MKLFINIIVLILLMPLAFAIPPVTQIQQFVSGYEIKAPVDNTLKANQNTEFEIHVYNISNGLPITSGIDCYFHLYNSSGEHILTLQDSTPSTMFDYSFDVGGGNITKATTSFLVQCNSSSLGGYKEVLLDVTASGLVFIEGVPSFLGALILLIFLIACFLLFVSTIMQEVPMKVFFLIASFIFLMSSIMTSVVIINENNLGDTLSNTMVMFIYVLGAILFIIFAYIMIRQSVYAFELYKEKKGLSGGFNFKKAY
jgi:hypothetical protein